MNPYPSEKTYVGGKIIVCKTQPTSHMFWCWFKNLKVPWCWIVLLLKDFGQEFAFNNWCTKTLRTFITKKIPRKTFVLLTKTKTNFINLITSFWLRFAPSWISYNVSIWGYQQHISFINLPHNNSNCCDKIKTWGTHKRHLWNHTTNHHNME